MTDRGEAGREFNKGTIVRQWLQILLGLTYSDLKRKFGKEMASKLESTGCISEDEKAFWLIDYWCGKDVRGLIRMPFSRHWIMHIEAMCRIVDKLNRKA